MWRRSPEAKEALEKRLLHKRIHVKVYARDRYSRIIPECEQK